MFLFFLYFFLFEVVNDYFYDILILFLLLRFVPYTGLFEFFAFLQFSKSSSSSSLASTPSSSASDVVADEYMALAHDQVPKEVLESFLELGFHHSDIVSAYMMYEGKYEKVKH